MVSILGQKVVRGHSRWAHMRLARFTSPVGKHARRRRLTSDFYRTKPWQTIYCLQSNFNFL
jgi:hypothetical protein